MKANNITISFPNQGCDINCPYCISKMTGYLKSNEDLFIRNLKKARRLAINAGVSSVLLTSKGETTLSIDSDAFEEACSIFNDFPLEIQTNGRALSKNLNLVDELNENLIDVIAISIDDFETIDRFSELFKRIKENGMLIRITVNLLPETYEASFHDYIDKCHEYNIDQLTFRQINYPEKVLETDEAVKTKEWIDENISTQEASNFLRNMTLFLQQEGKIIRHLPFGAVVLDYEGISVTAFNYCVQEENSEEDIRSLIYQEDGHLHTSWASNASKLF